MRQLVGNHLLTALQEKAFYADEGGFTRMHADSIRLNELSGRVIGCAFTVLNALGTAFLGKVYENALAHEVREAGLGVGQQHSRTVTYHGAVVGQYSVDPLVERHFWSN